MTIPRTVPFWLGVVSFFVLNLGFWMVVWVVVPSFLFGLEGTAVRTGSMRPHIEAGDLVLLSPSDGVDLGPGTVIRFEQDGPATLHRILAVRDDGSYLTKGDANGTADQPVVTPASVRGTGVLLIPLIGEWFLQRDAAPGPVLAITAVVVACLAFGAKQALEPANDPWLDSLVVPRRIAARATATPLEPLPAHILDPARLVVLRTLVDDGVRRPSSSRGDLVLTVGSG